MCCYIALYYILYYCIAQSRILLNWATSLSDFILWWRKEGLYCKHFRKRQGLSGKFLLCLLIILKVEQIPKSQVTKLYHSPLWFACVFLSVSLTVIDKNMLFFGGGGVTISMTCRLRLHCIILPEPCFKVLQHFFLLITYGIV